QQARAVRLNGAPPEIDGRVDETVWEASPAVSDFRQKNPNEGAAVSEATEVRFLYSDNDLYVAIRAFDRQPEGVFGPLVRRDDEVSSDWVHVFLDTYLDRRTAYQFSVNPAGSRRDVFIYDDGARRDDTWDPVYDWASSVDGGGWSAELRIPFSQLRFPRGDSAVFGLRVSRLIKRLNEESNWPFVPRDQAGEVSHYGELVGLGGLPQPRRVELLPYTAGSRLVQPTLASDPLSGPRSVVRTGADVKLGLTSGLTMDLTINPDFGQVEADPAVVNLSGFENFFSEKRPFFVEGTDLLRFTFGSGFGGDEGLVYTRRIGRSPQLSPSGGGNFVDRPVETTILGAAKITGQMGGGWALGAAQALTAKENADILDLGGTPVASSPVEPLSSYSVLRVQRTTRLGRMTYGGIATGTVRVLDDDAFADVLHKTAFSGGADVRGRFARDAYEFETKVLGTHVQGTREALLRTQLAPGHNFQRPDQDYATLDSNRTSLMGYAGNIRLAKVTGFAVWSARYTTRSPRLETNDVGFLRRADSHQAQAEGRLRWLRPGRVFRQFEMRLSQDISSSHGWERSNTTTEIRFDGTFLNYWRFNQNAEWEPAYVDTRLLRGGPAIDVPAHYHFIGGINSDSRRALTFNVSWNPTIEDESGKKELTLNAGLNWRPPGPVSLSVSLRRNWLSEDRQYITTGQAGGVPQYVMGRMKRREISITMRSDIAMSPRLSLQLYAQPFASGRTFDELRLVTRPRTGKYLEQFGVLGPDRLTRAGDGSTVRVDVNRDGVNDLSFAEPNRTVLSLRTNAVLRWEFRPGSTLYLVWNQNRGEENFDGTLRTLHHLGDAVTSGGTHVFALKMAYWIGL
ncbi:MAG: carbohydrate binding family 9 domain-containing protein, partial [Gemmatimonadetes bacterium]|nr:carbohydrate binding family 9 domain-containing protein [Gemmatimonadota bacterium]